jgi:PAS domain S-box-containing protein
MDGIGGPLTVGFLRANADTLHQSPDERWLLWILQDIMLLQVAGDWPASVAGEHLTEIWNLFLALREKHNPVFLVIDTADLLSPSHDLRDLLRKHWSQVLERDDLVVCVAASDPVRRAVRNTMAVLEGRLDQLRFFKDPDAALGFIEQRRQHGRRGGEEPSPADLDVVEQLRGLHEGLAELHGQDALESEIVADLEHRFRQMLLEFPAAVFYLGLRGSFAWVNRATESLFGYPASELIGVPYFESGLGTFDDLERARQILGREPGGSSVPPSEWSLVRKDGSRERVEVSAGLTSFGPKTVILCVATSLSAHRPGKSAPPRRAAGRGVLCTECHRIKDRSGRWLSPEQFHRLHHGLRFERGICPACGGDTPDDTPAPLPPSDR